MTAGPKPFVHGENASRCDSCGGTEWRFDRTAQDILSLPDRIRVVECARCGLRRLDPYLSDEELQQLYSGAYFGAATETGIEGVTAPSGNYQAEYVPLRLEKFRATVRALRGIHPGGKTLLDFGAATGDFVSIAIEEGLAADGVELSQYAVEVARGRGLDIRHGGFDAIPYAKYDFVHLHHVFEHLTQPADALSALVSRLAPGGVLYIEIPYQFHRLERLRFRLRGSPRGAPNLHSYHHPYFYTPSTLSRMLRAAGLEVLSIRTFVPSHYRARGSGLIKKAGWWALDRVFAVGNIIEAISVRR